MEVGCKYIHQSSKSREFSFWAVFPGIMDGFLSKYLKTQSTLVRNFYKKSRQKIFISPGEEEPQRLWTDKQTDRQTDINFIIIIITRNQAQSFLEYLFGIGLEQTFHLRGQRTLYDVSLRSYCIFSFCRELDD